MMNENLNVLTFKQTLYQRHAAA